VEPVYLQILVVAIFLIFSIFSLLRTVVVHVRITALSTTTTTAAAAQFVAAIQKSKDGGQRAQHKNTADNHQDDAPACEATLVDIAVHEELHALTDVVVRASSEMTEWGIVGCGDA
jgi:hypothetical protein